MVVKSNFDPIIKINGNFTDKDKIIEFLDYGIAVSIIGFYFTS